MGFVFELGFGWTYSRRKGESVRGLANVLKARGGT